MGKTVIKTLSLQGAQAKVVEVESNYRNGLNKFIIVGLPDRTIAEAKERITCALINQKFKYPYGQLVVNLLPAHYYKNGTYFDLAIALSILCNVRTGKIKPNFKLDLEKTIIIGELALDGTIRSTPLVPALVAEALKLGFENILIPINKDQNQIGNSDSEIFNSIISKSSGKYKIIPVKDLSSAYQTLILGNIPKIVDQRMMFKFNTQVVPEQESNSNIGLDVLFNNSFDRRVLEICAIGRHNLLLDGVPGSGKTLLANCLKYMLPQLNDQEMIEVMSIKALAGIKDETDQKAPPFRTPHHTSSEIAILGGGRPPQPGEISLAHHGVLFLDEISEFPRSILESLRQPLIDKLINISRNSYKVTYLTDFQLICTRNSCPCGWFGSQNRKCHCSLTEIKKYQAKLSGALLDRIDIKYRVEPHDYASYDANRNYEKTLNDLCKRVNNGRKILSKTYQPDNSLENLDQSAKDLVKTLVNTRKLSWRSLAKVVKLARTIAVLDSQTEKYQINQEILSEAIWLNSPDWSTA